MLTLISLTKLITEIAWLALLGQWVLGRLAGPRKAESLVYQLLQLVGSPFVRLIRLVAPRTVLQRNLPGWAFLLLSLLWVGATAAKIHHCLQIGVQLCH